MKINRKIKKTLSLFLAVAILFLNNGINVKAETIAAGIDLRGYMIEAEDSENFLRYGSDGILMTPVSWEMTNIVLNNNMFSAIVNTGVVQKNISGVLYLSFNQSNGYNYVAYINGNGIETLYFSICENIEEQYLFTNEEIEGYGVVWYLYDANGDLYIFEQNFEQEAIEQELLSGINIVAPKENDTQWFIHKMEPVASRVINPEDGISPCSSLSGAYTVDIGSIYENEFYLNGMLIETTCLPFLEFIPDANVLYNAPTTGWSMNLAIYQRVTNNGNDITGSIGNVYSLKNIDYSVGLKGNAVFSSFTPTYTLTTWGDIPNATLYEGIKSLLPSRVSNAMTIAQILAAILTSGAQMSVSSNTFTTTSKGYNVDVSSNYYIANDTASSGDSVGFEASIATEDPTLSRGTAATIGIKCNFDVVGGSTDGERVTLSHNHTFITNY